MKLSDADLAYLETHGKGGIYCIALKDEVWQAKLAKADDPDESDAYPLCYVGQSVNVRKRIDQHIKELDKNKHTNPRLQNAYKKHGSDAFECWIIEGVVSESDLDAREQAWMDLLYSHNRARGYNLAPIAGSTRGVKWTEQQRAQHSGEGNPNFGKSPSEETLKKRRASMECVRDSVEYRERHAASVRKFTSSPEFKKLMQQKTAELWQNADFREKTITNLRKAVSSADYKEKQAAASKERWLDTAYREKMRNALKGLKPSPEAVAKTRATRMAKGNYAQSETTRAKISAALTGRKRSPEAVARSAAARVGVKQSPETVAKRVATRRATMERKRRAAILANLAILMEPNAEQVAA